jgi:diacylglycerol kinase family enzyme
MGGIVRVLVICNLLAGPTCSDVYDLAHALGQRDCEVVLRYFNGSGPLIDLVGDGESFDRVIAAGGDGTVSSLAYALRGSHVPLVAFPSGTANLIASYLGMPFDPLRLADVVLEGDQLDFDLGELTHMGSLQPLAPEERKGFLLAAGAGFDAAIMEAAKPLKTSMGVLAYLAGIMQNLAPTRASFRVHLDGREIQTEGIAVLVVNTGKVQFDLSITHSSDPRDGRLEVALVRSKTAVGLLPAVWDALLDKVVERPERGPLEIESAQEVLVESDPPLRLQYDGDAIDCTTPFGARVLPGAARFVIGQASWTGLNGTGSDSRGRPLPVFGRRSPEDPNRRGTV